MRERPTLREGGLRGTAAEAGRRILRWQFLGETWAELKKAEWPTRQEALRLTGIVIALSLAVGALMGALDFFFTLVTGFLLGG